ncbi:hypothetical protein Tco_0097671 [Tanacetum coccineum]
MATESQKQDTSSRSGKMLMLMIGLSDPYIMKSQWLRYNADDNVSAIATTAYEQPEFNNEGKDPKGHRFQSKPTSVVHKKLRTRDFVLSEPSNGSNADITNQCESEQALDVSACTLLSTSTSFNPIKEGLRVWPRSSMFKRCLITADQASVFMAMTSVHISSGLVLHQMTSDHNRSELENSRYSNAVSSSGFKSVPLESKTATPDKSWIYYSPSLSL